MASVPFQFAKIQKNVVKTNKLSENIYFIADFFLTLHQINTFYYQLSNK